MAVLGMLMSNSIQKKNRKWIQKIKIKIQCLLNFFEHYFMKINHIGLDFRYIFFKPNHLTKKKKQNLHLSPNPLGHFLHLQQDPNHIRELVGLETKSYRAS